MPECIFKTNLYLVITSAEKLLKKHGNALVSSVGTLSIACFNTNGLMLTCVTIIHLHLNMLSSRVETSGNSPFLSSHGSLLFCYLCNMFY